MQVLIFIQQKQQISSILRSTKPGLNRLHGLSLTRINQITRIGLHELGRFHGLQEFI